MNYCIGCEEECEKAEVKVVCESCGCSMSEDDAMRHLGQTVCPNCANAVP